MVGGGDRPPGHASLPRPGAVVWVVALCVAGIRWWRPLTTEAHPVPELGRLLLAALVAAVLLAAAEARAVISSLDTGKMLSISGNSFWIINQEIFEKRELVAVHNF